MLRIGCVKYLNARPLIHGWQGQIQFDHPSALCQRLANAELDVALVSSFEFLRNPIYRIVDDVSISSDGPVYSVVVAHRGDLAKVQEIELDPASQTAVNLLRCLLAELGLKPRLVQRSTGILPVGQAGVLPAEVKLNCWQCAHLIIGDQAIQFRQRHSGEFQFWDLGEQWKKLTTLSFVYALWLIRPEVVDAHQIGNRLRSLRDNNIPNLDELIREAVPGIGDHGDQNNRSHEFFCRYYRKHLRFSFGEKGKQGLRSFAKLCIKHGLLPNRDVALQVI